ncbi:MAG TPA: acetate kinase [Chthoniobacterales bacterium]|nr:acetate kinase [Chthoniobacterales bacterium]
MTNGKPQILVINSGSSSLKFSVLEVRSESVLASGIAERLGTREASLKFCGADSERIEEPLSNADHRAVLRRVIDHLRALLANEVDAVGHRIVHGGEYFRDAVIIDDEVVKRIEELSDLAPLHNPPGAQGIRVASELFPDKPQVAVFDTAFHQTLPPHAFHYAIPPKFYSRYRIRRYGFHGTSTQYVTQELARRLGRPLGELQLLTAHLGNGCSATAVKQGKSVDTTMGLTPLEGLVMGTRSGDVDPSLHHFLQEREGLNLREITDLLTRESGLLGVSGVSQDMRSILQAIDAGNARAKLAVDVFCYRLARALLGLAAGLDRIDGLIFTGGIGENSAVIRARVLQHLQILRPAINQGWNKQHGRGNNGRITEETGLSCFVIPTNEELMIARQTAALVLRH